MEPTRRRTSVLELRLDLVCILLLLAVVVPSGMAQCEQIELFRCIITRLNMSAGGFAELNGAIAHGPYGSYYVRKLIVPNAPSGAFLQRMGTVAGAISFDVYHDPVIQLPATTDFRSLELYSAPTLRVFIADGPNDQLEELLVQHSVLDHIPPTLGKLHQLTHLRIMYSRLDTLSIDALASNGLLIYLELRGNRIARVDPLTNTGAKAPQFSIKVVDLSENLIEHLDMTVWGPLKTLQLLNLQNNRLMTLATPQPIELANLRSLYLEANQLKALDLRTLSLPRLETITLNGNYFTEIPATWGTKESLTFINMDNNSLTTLNFRALRSLTFLEIFMANFNHIQSVAPVSSSAASSPPVHLPQLHELDLHGNALSHFPLNGTDFPKLGNIGLTQNHFTEIPPVFKKYPDVYLTLEANPLKCASVKAYRVQLVAYQLMITYAWGDDRCPEKYVTYDGFKYCCTD